MGEEAQVSFIDYFKSLHIMTRPVFNGKCQFMRDGDFPGNFLPLSSQPAAGSWFQGH